MGAEIPAEVPSSWMICSKVDDVDGTAKAAADAGGTIAVPPQDYFGGRFAIIRDPQGATFGLAKSSDKQPSGEDPRPWGCRSAAAPAAWARHLQKAAGLGSGGLGYAHQLPSGSRTVAIRSPQG